MAKPDPLRQELYYLIAKFLEGGPCQGAAQLLRKEINEHALLPQRTDFHGNKHDITIEHMEQNCPLDPDYLFRLCENLCVSLNTAVPTALAGASRTLLGKGRHSALRTKQSVNEKRLKHTNELICHRAGRKLLSTWTTKSPSIVELTDARRSTTVRNMLSLAPVSLYSGSSLFRRIAGHLSSVYCVLYDQTGRFIFTGADDILVKIWSSSDGRLMATLRGHASEITDLTLSPDNSMLASGSLDKTIRVWCLKTLRPVAVLIGHTSMVTSLKFCPSVMQGISFLSSTGNDGNLCFWQYTHASKTFSKEPKRFADRAKAAAQLLCQSFSPGGTLLATGSTDHIVRIYQIFKPKDCLNSSQEPERIAELSGHNDRVDSIQFAHNDTRLITGSRDGTANIWSFRSNRWTPLTLKMTSALDSADEGVNDLTVKQKLKVNMVAWTKDDSNVMTTVSDHTVKIWNSRSGQLVRILKGHEDDVYSLECHPTDRRVLYTGGHDGRVIIWDMTTGRALKTFYNFFEGQGYGAMFDLKVSPDGLTFCATDSHGHLSIYGLGSGEAYAKVPDEQFFHTDYQPLIRDASHFVVDEQTQLAPHLMPAPFLVNIDLRPYPAALQRLVPGRENCPDELLVPVQNQEEQEEDGRRPNIDDMIVRMLGPGERRAPSTPSSRGGMRRDGEVEGVRQENNYWGVGSTGAMSVPRKKMVVPPLSESEIQREIDRLNVWTDTELKEFVKERRREQNDLASQRSQYGLRQKEKQSSSGRSRRGVFTLADLTSSGRPTRSVPVDDDMEIDDEDFDENGESDSDYLQDSPSRERNRNRRENERSQQNGTNRGGTRSRRGAPTRDEQSSSAVQNSSSSTDDDESEDSESSEEQEAEGNAEDTGVRRSKRQQRAVRKKQKQKKDRKSGGSRPATQRATRRTQDDENEEEAHESPDTAGSSRRRPNELPERFRPPDWLTDTMPRRTPYLPQVGDVVMYFQQGHQLYCDAVRRRRLYKLERHNQFAWNRKLRDQEKVRVLDVKFELLPPRLCIVKVECTDPVDASCEDPFWIRYHDCSDVIDFLVLFQTFQTAMQRDWKAGDRFRSIIEDKWWLGTIEMHDPIQSEFPDSMFQCFTVKWDNGESERMSPWDFEPIDPNRVPTEPDTGIEITVEEREAMQYVPTEDDFDKELREAFRLRMMSGLDKIMSLSIAEPFLVPVDLNSYPDYARVVAYPIDLSTVRARLENNFYRRKEGIKFDASYLEYNANQFNEPDSVIVKQATLLTRVLLQFIDDVKCDDPLPLYHRLSSERSTKADLSSDDSGEPGPSRKLYLNGSLYGAASKASPRKTRENVRRPTTRTTSDWRERCINLLVMLNQREDSQPFRLPVDTEEIPDYAEVVDQPMDLLTVSQKLESNEYDCPEDFAKDMQLIFTNSRNYNTNKRSRIYSMTIRLSAMFEDQMRALMAEHKAAIKRAQTRKTYDESDADLRDRARRTGRRNGMMNGHSSTQRLRRMADVDEEDEEEEIVSNAKSTRSGRTVRPTRFTDMVSMSDEDPDRNKAQRKSSRNAGSREAASNSAQRTETTRKRKITETEDEEAELSSGEAVPRVLKTRSGRTVKLMGSSSSSFSSASSSSPNSHSTSDESGAASRRKATAANTAKKRPTVKNAPAKRSRTRQKASSEDDIDEEEEGVEEEDLLDHDEEEAVSSEEITTEDSPQEQRARRKVTKKKPQSEEDEEEEEPEDEDVDEDSEATPRRSGRKRGSSQVERPSRAAKVRRTLVEAEDDDHSDDEESRPTRSRKLRSSPQTNGNGASSHSTSQSDIGHSESSSGSASTSGRRAREKAEAGRVTRTNGRTRMNYAEDNSEDDDLLEDEDLVVMSSRGRVCKLRGSFTRPLREAR